MRLDSMALRPLSQSGDAAGGQSDLHQTHIDLGLEDFQASGAELGSH